MKTRYHYCLSLLLALSLTACDSKLPEMEIELKTDYTQILQAISDANKSLADKMALIQAAAGTGLAQDQTLLQLIQEALASLGGSLEQKLAAIKAAMLDQSTALETKMALVEAAAKAGYADAAAQQALLQQALSTLTGTLEQKLSAIEEAIKAQTTAWETKLGLIEAAVQAGFANAAAQQELLQKALDSLEGTLEEKLAAVEAAVESESTSLAVKLALLSSAMDMGFFEQNAAIGLMQTALVSSLHDMDVQYSSIRKDVLEQLAAVSAKLTTEELSKVFKQIADAISTHAQSSEEQLETIQKTVHDIWIKLAPTTFSLTPVLPTSFGFRTGWETGDSLYVFFPDVAAPKHLRMGYDGTQWTSQEMNGNVKSNGCLDTPEGTSNKLTAVFVPASPGVSISSADGIDFLMDYTPTYGYLTGRLDYTVTEKSVSGNLELQIPEGFVQFLLPDADALSGTQIELREPGLTPQGVASVAQDGTVTTTSIARGAPLKGYAVSGAQKGYAFGGILLPAARNVATDYYFTLVKGGWKGNYYSRKVTGKTVETAAGKVPGESLDGLSNWNSITDFKPVDMGCDVEYKLEWRRVYWAQCNLGASAEGDYGNYYAWGEVSPKDKFYWKNYKWSNADSTAVTKYLGNNSGSILQPEDDAASMALGDTWRMPTTGDWDRLGEARNYEWTMNGTSYVVTSKKAGYNGPDGPSLTFPLSGYYGWYYSANDYTLVGQGSLFCYWSSSLSGNAKDAYYTSWSGSILAYTTKQRYCGMPVRPVTF